MQLYLTYEQARIIRDSLEATAGRRDFLKEEEIRLINILDREIEKGPFTFPTYKERTK